MPRVCLRLMSVLPWLLAGCAGPAAEPPPQAAAAQAPRVSVQPLSALLQPRHGTAPATVRAGNDSVLASEVTAAIAGVEVDVGSRVGAGDLLVTLDDTDLRLALAQAQARVAAADARASQAGHRLQRARGLQDRQFIAEDEVLALETEHEAALADVAVARADRDVAARAVGKTRIRAPFAAVVIERQAQVGALAGPGTPLLRLVDLAAAEVEASLQVGDAAAIGEARDLAFESQGVRLPVRLLRLAPVVEAGTRGQLARFAFTQAAAPAGSAGTLHWQWPASQLPAPLLVRRGDAVGVFLVESGNARFLAVPGAVDGRPFALDLPGDTLLVTRGQQGLADGDAVVLASDDPEPEA